MGSAFPAEPDGWTRGAERRVMFALAFPDWVCHVVYPECGIECPHAVHECGLMGEPLTDHTIDTESSALMALRIIVNAFAAAGVATGDPLPQHEVTDSARHQSVMGAQKNVGFMARGLAATLLNENITRFGQLPHVVVHPVVSCHVVTDPSTNISVRAYATVEFERPLLVLDAVGAP